MIVGGRSGPTPRVLLRHGDASPLVSKPRERFSLELNSRVSWIIVMTLNLFWTAGATIQSSAICLFIAEGYYAATARRFSHS